MRLGFDPEVFFLWGHGGPEVGWRMWRMHPDAPGSLHIRPTSGLDMRGAGQVSLGV